MVSIVILTKNEAQDINICLMSVQWSDDIHILDSGSTDKTIEMPCSQSYPSSKSPVIRLVVLVSKEILHLRI